MFEPTALPMNPSVTTVDMLDREPEVDNDLELDVDADADAELGDGPGLGEMAEVHRVAQARLDRMFPRTGPGRSALRMRKAQHEARARRAAKKIFTDPSPSSWQASLPRYGAIPSAGSLPGIAAGPELAAAIAQIDITRVSENDLVHVVTATERLASWTTATQAEAISVLANRDLYDLEPPPGRHRVVPAAIAAAGPDELATWKREVECVRAVAVEIGAALNLSRGSAEARVWTARALTGRHPGTLALLRAGTIDGPRSRVIVDELDPDLTGLSTTDARKIEATVLRKAGKLTAPRLRSLVRHERIRLAPTTAEAEHRKAKTGRRVEFTPAEDGMGWVNAYLSADAIAAIRAALDAAADTLKAGDQAAARAHAQASPTLPDEPPVRTIDQCRADAFAEMAWLALDTGHLGGCPDGTKLARPRGNRPRVQLTVPASTLLGLDQQPGQLNGYGPIPASLARAIAEHGDWYRILTDPLSGTVLDVGTTRYAPPADLALHVQTRDRTCRGPGCGQPAHRTDLDHTIEHPVGPTAAYNLGPLCRHHHLTKHRREWRLTQPRPGVFEWTSPAGRSYPIAPEQVGPLRDPPMQGAEGALDTGASATTGHDPPAAPAATRWPGRDDIPPF